MEVNLVVSLKLGPIMSYYIMIIHIIDINYKFVLVV